MESRPPPQAPLTVWTLHKRQTCRATYIEIISEHMRWQGALAVEREHDTHAAIANAH
jgi:hypothetical protein|tara:strand:- start:576 stop:746 length:171 start_codon:yes stop_codon:yes gene_type:complete